VPSVADPYELQPGDLCVYVGRRAHSRLRHRVIYRVTDKIRTQEDGSNEWLSCWRYTFERAFDMFPTTDDRGDDERRVDTSLSISKNGTRHVMKLDIMQLCLLRNQLDLFIADEAKRLQIAHVHTEQPEL